MGDMLNNRKIKKSAFNICPLKYFYLLCNRKAIFASYEDSTNLNT